MKHTRVNKTRDLRPKCPDGPKCDWCSRYNLHATRRREAEAGPASIPLPDATTINGHILIFDDEELGPDDYSDLLEYY